MIKQLQ